MSRGALLGGGGGGEVWGQAPQRKIFKSGQFSAFWRVFCNSYDIQLFFKCFLNTENLRKNNVKICIFFPIEYRFTCPFGKI